MQKRSFGSQDVQQNKTMGGLGYLVFFLPLITSKNSPFARYCASQGLWLWIAHLAIWVVFGIVGYLLGWVPILGGILAFVKSMMSLAVGILQIYFAISAISNGVANEVPIVGSIELIK